MRFAALPQESRETRHRSRHRIDYQQSLLHYLLHQAGLFTPKPQSSDFSSVFLLRRAGASTIERESMVSAPPMDITILPTGLR